MVVRKVAVNHKDGDCNCESGHGGSASNPRSSGGKKGKSGEPLPMWIGWIPLICFGSMVVVFGYVGMQTWMRATFGTGRRRRRGKVMRKSDAERVREREVYKARKKERMERLGTGGLDSVPVEGESFSVTSEAGFPIAPPIDIQPKEQRHY